MNNGVCRRIGDWNQNICCGLVSFGLFDWIAIVQGFETQLSYDRLNSGTYILWIWEELKKCKHIAYCCLQFCKGDDERQPVLLEIFHFPFFMFTIVHHKGILFIIRRLGGLCLSAKDRKSAHGHFRQTNRLWSAFYIAWGHSNFLFRISCTAEQLKAVQLVDIPLIRLHRHLGYSVLITLPQTRNYPRRDHSICNHN